MALLKCRGANMPNDNIERAIKKGTGGGESGNFDDLTYEVYGPHGVAMLVELSTDNRNRHRRGNPQPAHQERREHCGGGSGTPAVPSPGANHYIARGRQ